MAFANAQARLLMTRPGVGPITALAFVVTIGDVGRFKRGKQVASYLGLIPSERSSGQRRRLGAISKQGNVFLRTMLVEAAQSAVRHDEEFKKEYAHRCHSKPTGVAKVAAARKLAVRLYWMLRTQTPYPEVVRKVVRNEGSGPGAERRSVDQRMNGCRPPAGEPSNRLPLRQFHTTTADPLEIQG